MIMPVLEFKNATHEERLDKLTEEYNEVIEAVKENKQLEEILSEYIDTIQVCITNMYHIAKHEEVEEAFTKHELKMIDRGYDIKSCLSMRLL